MSAGCVQFTRAPRATTPGYRQPSTPGYRQPSTPGIQANRKTTKAHKLHTLVIYRATINGNSEGGQATGSPAHK